MLWTEVWWCSYHLDSASSSSSEAPASCPPCWSHSDSCPGTWEISDLWRLYCQYLVSCCREGRPAQGCWDPRRRLCWGSGYCSAGWRVSSAAAISWSCRMESWWWSWRRNQENVSWKKWLITSFNFYFHASYFASPVCVKISMVLNIASPTPSLTYFNSFHIFHVYKM